MNWVDPLGLAEIGSRGLSGLSNMFAYGKFRHDQIWYNDGSNSGFLDDYNIGTDYIYTKKDYIFTDRYPNSYDDSLMHQAEANVKKNWNKNWTLANNCQDYVKAAIKEYKRLVANKLSRSH